MVNDTLAIIAVENASSAPAWIQPIVSDVFMWIGRISIFVGGIFGLYLIFLLLQWREKLVLNKRLKRMEEDLRLIKEKLDIASKNSTKVAKSKKNSDKER